MKALYNLNTPHSNILHFSTSGSLDQLFFSCVLQGKKGDPGISHGRAPNGIKVCVLKYGITE